MTPVNRESGRRTSGRSASSKAELLLPPLVILSGAKNLTAAPSSPLPVKRCHSERSACPERSRREESAFRPSCFLLPLRLACACAGAADELADAAVLADALRRLRPLHRPSQLAALTARRAALHQPADYRPRRPGLACLASREIFPATRRARLEPGLRSGRARAPRRRTQPLPHARGLRPLARRHRRRPGRRRPPVPSGDEGRQPRRPAALLRRRPERA